MKKLIECVPNISEGRDKEKIELISKVVEKVEGVKLLNVDPGNATNRTVITFLGEPQNVIDAAFLLVKTAQENIDMSLHKGEHPRMGATDVCPLVPISNITMQETVEWAQKLAKMIGNELGIPVYCYEEAATKPERKNLANCRSGEYEAMSKKIETKEWKPDYGPDKFNETVKKSGVTAVGARDFLIAYNVNLNTTSTRRANSIAFDIREAGRIKREGGKLDGKIIKDKKGNPLREPGMFKSVKGIGWFIKEYNIAQISYNLTDITVSPLHLVFDKTCEQATKKGIRVTGSELIGLVPKKVLIDAGEYFLKKQKRSLGVPESEIINIAVKSLGLDDLFDFNPNERIIEYLIEEPKEKLSSLSLTDFANETSSESPAPGGGSISAYCGTLAASLTTMVANLSSHKRGWDDRWEFFSDWAKKGLDVQNELIDLVDKDTDAFNQIIESIRLPKDTEQEIKNRNEAISKATKNAILVPLAIMEKAYDCMKITKEMALYGNPNSISDAGVASLCAIAAIKGGLLNVKINCKDFDDLKFIKSINKKTDSIIKKSKKLEIEIMNIVEEKL
ncbi:glutamate formimidoyltransferase [Bacteroidota bacterium]|nr:glutamate formimidoyltransferase [Bacteroidota bacterium]MDC3230561.1 glutamate formimidoyltransferase [Bacteroidota bacterium]